MSTQYTSSLGESLAFTGFALFVGTQGNSPENFTPIVNLQDFNIPLTEVVTDTTNAGDQWVRRTPTVQDMGKITFKVFWQPEDPSMANNGGSSTVAPGLMYLFVNRIKADWQAKYPNGTVFAFPAYVTDMAIAGKVKDNFMLSVTLSNSGAPSLA